ncbi:MAG TPA: hypothetical protein VJH03_05055 [Blastocatellia bacterium]|nr:hypothetical protein [Blastocatellia bacterium]
MMKTILSLILLALPMVCCRDRSAPPTVLSAKNDSRDSRSASGEAEANQADTPTNEAAPQTQKVELRDPNDELHVANKMLERVKQEGAIRIVSVHPSRDKYVFVAEVEGEREGGLAQDSTPKTDLWVVNKNGTGLRRLTDDKQSRDPVWSPSGEEIAFISKGSVRIIGSDSELADSISFGSATPVDDDVHVEYSRPTVSPNGKGIAALAKDGTTSWVEVRARSNGGGGEVHLAKGFERYEWNSESELVLDTGRLVFDWEHLSPGTETSADSASDADALKTDKGGDEKAPLPPELLNRLLKKLSAHGVMKIGACAISPSGNRIVLEGVFDESPQYAGGPPTKDLWLVNRDGSRLRRLTHDNVSYAPVWSPSGKEIAFTAFGFYSSVGIIDVRTQKVRWLSGLQALNPGAQGTHARRNWGYDGPRWSLDGKVIAAVGRDGEGDDWITVVDARSGNKLFQTKGGGYSFSWNHDGELVIPSLGKFVFDWNSALFKRH